MGFCNGLEELERVNKAVLWEERKTYIESILLSLYPLAGGGVDPSEHDLVLEAVLIKMDLV